MLSLIDPNQLTLGEEGNLLAKWIYKTVYATAKSPEQEFIYVSALAYNCLTGTWTEPRDELKAEPVVHFGNDWCRAHPDWFGNDLEPCLPPSGAALEIDMAVARRAFGTFSLKFFSTYYTHVLRRLDDLLAGEEMYARANRNVDLDLLAKLRVFTPFLETLETEKVDVGYVRWLNAHSCALANRVHALPCHSYKWEAEIELCDLAVLGGTAALYFFERELNPAFA